MTPPTSHEREAIEWEVALRSGEDENEIHNAFERWRNAEPAHAAAWDELQNRLIPLAPRDPASAAAIAMALRGNDHEQQEQETRRRLLRAGFTLGMLALAGVGLRGAIHELGFDADWRSGTGQRATVKLADGGTLTLDAGSRVYRKGTPARAWLELASGQVLLQTGLGKTCRVATADGIVSTNGATLTLGRFGERSLLALRDGSAELRQPNRDGTVRIVTAGQALYFGAGGDEASSLSFDAASAWTRGVFVADRLPLAQLASAFNRYRHGFVRVRGPAAQRRISGVFALDDIDAALRQAADTLSLRLDHYGSLLVVLS